ncbi:MAG TPA: FAD-binding protein [Actinomycetota bacterium]|nr:FAD-binding protein [Actinomycetota bacterium]
MDLIHPASKADVVDVVRDANASQKRLLVAGGRRHMDKGNPSEVDAELWTTQLDRLVSYEPAEMIAVVEPGIRVGELRRVLAGGGQEWPSDAPHEATVGGVIASGASSARRLKVGALRDTVLEVEAVTGDGRLVRSGARTVKNVTGYDLHKAIAGSLGTLAVVVQVALKVRPLPRARRTLAFEGDLALAATLAAKVPGAAAVLARPDAVELRLEGWPEEVEAQASIAERLARSSAEGDGFPLERPWDAAPVVAEVAVPPSKLEWAVPGDAWGALAGVGLAWVGLDSTNGDLDGLRERVHAIGGIAPAIKGPGGLGSPTIPAEKVQRRLKTAFDPNGVLAPGRGWGGL